MTATEIVKEIPKLTELERRAVRQALLDVANQDPQIAACNEAALQGALMLDRMEDDDAQRKGR